MIDEIWKFVVGFEGIYEVSDSGRVRSVSRLVIRGDGKPYPVVSRIRKQVTNPSGHKSITLRYSGVRYPRLVHRLVLEAFFGPCPDELECCHNDGDPGNNHVSNLRWDTRSANKLDTKRHGTMTEKENHGMAKMTEVGVIQMREMYATGDYMQKDLAEKFGVSKSMASYIINGDNWKL